ncbi:hypothetical protein PHMEG_00025328 [Phytophthora megakarya]|uniref:SWIM-type domain-containing protein n=1 Tax=Phytophthora megakarya TaxID=4795 RepID=A0A225VBX1_9STRA|nr:hypothetical protein PHMEG_00025328 [Phytophthora megakarya]
MESAGARKTAAPPPATEAGSGDSSSDLPCHQTISSDEEWVESAEEWVDSAEDSSIRTNNKVAQRNNRIAATKSKQPKVPEDWVNYGKTFYKARGKGKRKRQQSRMIDCNAQINACVQALADTNPPVFKLRITSCRLEHSHPLSEHTFNNYPHIRTAYEPEVADTLTYLAKAGAKKKRIIQFIHENSKCKPIAHDIHKFVLRLKKQGHTAPTSAKRVKLWMKEFTQEAGNVGGIFVGSANSKTKHMREIFDRFPEVVMIDATHGANSSKYKIFSIMAHDSFGKGQFVQHAVVQNERNPTLLTSLEEFKRNNPAWTRIKCILIDKDFGKISVLTTAFPNATLLLCQFHVLKYLREQIASKDYGFTSWEKEQLDGIVNLLVYTRNEREFLKIRAYMRHIMLLGSGSTRELGVGSGELGVGSGELGVGSGDDRPTQSDEPTHAFEVYFSKNWDNCLKMWCAFERQNACTLGNNTNNRLEASWKQLKELVNQDMHVDECIVAIMYYRTQEENRFIDAIHNLSIIHNPKYDMEIKFLSKLVSEHACELIYEQYTYATTQGSYKFHEAVPGVYVIQFGLDEDNALDEPSCEYSVTKSTWVCSCLFMASRLLPCRHVFYIRKVLGFENIIPTQMLDSRWLLSSLRSKPERELPAVSGDPLRIEQVL